jgi:oxaloacetate decarboxylase alpha subunit
VFRIFDALNDPRNLKRAADAAKKTGKHVQMAISYATTPYHTKEVYANLAKEYAKFGADSICIKDMSGLLKPYEAYELVKAIKAEVDIPLQIHSHATTGMSVATLTKAAEAGADVLDTVISSMAMGTSHSPTETLVEILKGTEMDTGLDINALLEIAAYFRDIRKHYEKFESSFLGADTRILVSQVPGGMLSNLESQLKEQGAGDKIDEVLKEIPIVQKDCGYIPLVTPTSQIVGTQAVFNVLFGRYNKLTAETRDLLTGRYGKTPAACNADLVKQALSENNMTEAVTERPADLIPNEWDKLLDEAKEHGADGSVEDTLTYAMFPKVAPKFFSERANGPVKSESFAVAKAAPTNGGPMSVSVNGTSYNVSASPSGDVITVNGVAYNVAFGAATAAPVATANTGVSSGADITAPVAGTLLKHVVPAGTTVKKGDTVIMIESMKMELEVKATQDGPVSYSVNPGSAITAGQVLGAIGGGAPLAAAPVQEAPQAAPSAPQAAQAPSGGTVIPAPVAGTYLKATVADGAQVSPGQTIIMIESMKMELEVKATDAGTVHFLVNAGTAINAGQALAEIK